MFRPTMEQVYFYHAQDREIFSKLVLNLARLPAESLLVMATWFWFEDFGFGSIFSTLAVLSDLLIQDLANEACASYKCLESNTPPSGGYHHLPVTSRFLQNDISLQLIYQNRFTAIAGIKNFLNTTCSRVFTDILQQVLPSSGMFNPRYPLLIPGFPHSTFGNIKVLPVVRDNLPPSKNILLYPHGLWGWSATKVTNDKERTVFLTFSRGFPVSPFEVFQLFNKLFGENCVQSVYMQEDGSTSSNRNNISNNDEYQSLYARMVVDSVVTVDRILTNTGEEKEKFKINGKHIWARKYENREYPNHLNKSKRI